MEMTNPLEYLTGLLSTFERDLRVAKALDSPNPEDDLAVRIAVVGFSYHSATEEWGREHLLYLRERIDEDYSLEGLAWYGTSAESVRLFAALCIGYLLGLYQSGEVDDLELFRAEVLLPGVIATNAPRLCGSKE